MTFSYYYEALFEFSMFRCEDVLEVSMRSASGTRGLAIRNSFPRVSLGLGGLIGWYSIFEQENGLNSW